MCGCSACWCWCVRELDEDDAEDDVDEPLANCRGCLLPGCIALMLGFGRIVLLLLLLLLPPPPPPPLLDPLPAPPPPPPVAPWFSAAGVRRTLTCRRAALPIGSGAMPWAR